MADLSESGLKETIEELIKAGTSFDVAALERIYHEDLQVIMIHGNQKMISDKASFKTLFQTKLENGEAPLNTWRDFHHIEVNNTAGHIILSRKVNLMGEEQQLLLSIDLVWEANLWQVTREVIFAQ